MPAATSINALPSPPARNDGYLARTRRLLGAAIRRRWDEGLLTRDSDGLFTAFLGAQEVEKLLEAAPATGATTPIEDHRYPSDSPLGRLAHALDLGATELDLVAVLLACESDPATARLLTYLGGNQEMFSPTVDLLLDVVYRGRYELQSDAAAAILRDLAPQRRLRRLRIVSVDGAENKVALAQGLRLHPRATAWLLGDDALDGDLRAVATLRPPIAPPGEVMASLLDRVVAAFATGERLLLLEGPAQSGREMTLGFAAAFMHKPLLVVGGRDLGEGRLVGAFREAVLQGALLAVRDAGEALEGEALHRFRECLEVFPGTVALLGAGEIVSTLARLGRPMTTLRVPVPAFDDRLRLWRKYLGDDSAIPPVEMEQIASLYNLGVQGIVRASESAREAANFAGRPVERGDVTLAVRQLFDLDLTTVATRIEVSQGWDDLVLPDDLGESILGIIERVRHRGAVLGGWGFARKLGKGLGLTVLFSGEPGTGKSMAAGLIARELGLDLYVVDLSQVTSKWIGETEKNLARAFDAAEAGHVLLLFDEADSILAKRTSDMKSSNDRHANLETNYILARLEQFQGIAFFTTNLPSAIDPAISRRMTVHINFPFPDVNARAELWERMLPREVPVDSDINFHLLAQQYELSGGFIRNIVLRAAFMAVGDGGRVAMRHLKAAAEAEYRERGSLVVGGRLA